MDGMVWIPGTTFLMGSDRHYPEEVPARKVTPDGFWIDAGPVTNREFDRFVRKTRHVTMAERAPDPAVYPGVRPALLVPFSRVFVPAATGSAWPIRTTGGGRSRARTGGIRRPRQLGPNQARSSGRARGLG